MSELATVKKPKSKPSRRGDTSHSDTLLAKLATALTNPAHDAFDELRSASDGPVEHLLNWLIEAEAKGALAPSEIRGILSALENPSARFNLVSLEIPVGSLLSTTGLRDFIDANCSRWVASGIAVSLSGGKLVLVYKGAANIRALLELEALAGQFEGSDLVCRGLSA